MGVQIHNDNFNVEMRINHGLNLRIRTFGLVKIENPLGCYEETRKRQATPVLLLKYFLSNHNNAIPQEELFALFCPNSADPANLLHVWMARLNSILKPLNLSGHRGLILFADGQYRLNKDYINLLDSARIDQIVALLSATDQATLEGLALCQEALELYQGDFLENTETSPWLQEQQVHYRESLHYIATTALEYMRALNNTSLLPLLVARVTTFIPENDPLRDKLAAFQRTLQNQDNLAYFCSGEKAVQTSENDVYIRMFGPLELENQYGRVVDPETARYPSNSWLLLKYLLKNRGREVSQVELMEKFWPNELTSENADGTLRTRLSRLRKELTPLHLAGRNGLVLFSSGSYSINSDYIIHTDEDTFVQLMSQISQSPVDDLNGLALCTGALELFRDWFLADTKQCPWVQELQEYYNQEFLRLAFTTLERMKALDNTQSLPLLCRRARSIAPEEAVLHIEIISLLIEKGLFQEALQHIFELSKHNGPGFEWLEPTPFPSDASNYLNSEIDIRVRMFGEIELENQSGLVTYRHDTYRWTFLKRLLLHPTQSFSVQELESSFGPERITENPVMAQKELRRRLREALTPLNLDGQGLVLIESDQYRLNPKYHLILDTDILSEIMAQLPSVSVDDPSGAQQCLSALSLFRGPFMEHTWDAPWLTEHRNHYNQVYLQLVNSALERLQTLKIKQGLTPLWRSAVACAPENKDLHTKILTYLLEQNLPVEIIPYVCCLARMDPSTLDWFCNL